jgi:peptidoglycan hydrolase-like protein with peptidoglycan-binding domain
MSLFTRKFFSSAAIACFTLALAVSPAAAATHPKHKTHHVTRHHVASGSAIVRVAQRHLANLGYYSGTIDGKMGPQTRAAIKKFQREHALKADGALGSKTNRALQSADYGHAKTGQLLTHESVNGGDIGAPVNDSYVSGMNGGSRVVSSRFARVDVSESGSGGNKRYNVNLNGQPILVADGQPSVVGISSTYDLGNEDAVIFTTFSPNDSGCVYRNHVLALSNAGSKMLDLDNCTRDYQAVAKNGSLFITFTQHDSNSAIGSTWRLEGENLVRL